MQPMSQIQIRPSGTAHAHRSPAGYPNEQKSETTSLSFSSLSPGQAFMKLLGIGQDELPEKPHRLRQKPHGDLLER